MDYFLSITDSQYHHWQSELLIESFKSNNCENKLYIYVSSAEKAFSYNKNFIGNLLSHKRKKYFLNLGLQKGCSELNKIYSLRNALATKAIEQPVCVLEPDLVMKRQIDFRESDGIYSSFVFSIDPFSTIENAEKNVGPFTEWLGLERSFIESNWLPVGDSYIINKFPLEFFFKVVEDAEKLAVYQMLNGNKVWNRTCDLALTLNVISNVSKIYCRGDYQIIGPIDSDANASFVTYKNGYLPNFHKSMFKFEPPADLSLGDPIKVLSDLSFSPNSIYVSKIARKTIEQRK